MAPTRGFRREAVAAYISVHVRERYGEEIPCAPLPPPSVDLGDVGIPIAFELAKRLKRKPRELAEEIRKDLEAKGGIPGISRMDVAGAGYLNCFYRRSEFVRALETDLLRPHRPPGPDAERVVVEHTNINPNKAAHVGHLRNAVLGDTLARLLRYEGTGRVEVQNYIDDTGVQVADVVVGLAVLEGKGLPEVRALDPASFDEYCWDLYARVGRWYEEDGSRLEHRRKALHAMEKREGEWAEIGRYVAEAVLACHLRTMAWLGIRYDLLTRESDILQYHLWETAFARLREAGSVALEKDGKNAGCWVMGLRDSAEFAGLEDADKVIVRSDGTVTYVGKDIAYQMWKFGLLPTDFRYERRKPFPWEKDPQGGLWETTSGPGDSNAPPFGRAHRVYNVIDIRQAYLQKIVKEALRLLGHPEAADRSVHFSYEMVALSRKAAEALGMPADTAGSGPVGMSGRKGLGVKADDLLRTLEGRASQEIASRDPDLPEGERRARARAIAIGALRYFMLKYSRTKVIAFDFEEALQFEGETGPYLQYSAVRARNILRKLREERGEGAAEIQAAFGTSVFACLQDPEAGNALWEFVRAIGGLPEAVEAALRTEEPAGLLKYGFTLAQHFHTFYHRFPILHEPDATLRLDRAAIVHLYLLQMERVLDLLGIPVPERM